MPATLRGLARLLAAEQHLVVGDPLRGSARWRIDRPRSLSRVAPSPQFSATTGLVNVPMPSTVTDTESPGCSGPTAGRGAGENHIARQQGGEPADVLDQFGDAAQHVARAAVLLQFAVHGGGDLQVGRLVGDSSG